jgi:hypothetical protein
VVIESKRDLRREVARSRGSYTNAACPPGMARKFPLGGSLLVTQLRDLEPADSHFANV